MPALLDALPAPEPSFTDPLADADWASLPVEMVLFGFLLWVAIIVLRQRDLFAATMLTGIFSLVSAGLFTVMDAVDVAFTEAAVGAGISTVLVLATLSLTTDREEKSTKSPWLALVVVFMTGAALVVGTIDMPAYGDPDAPVHGHVTQHYLNESPNEIGLPNIVTSVLASYRGYDTFGELAVIFTAGVGVTLVLALRRRREDDVVDSGETPPEPRDDPGRAIHQQVSEMAVLRTTTKALIPFALLFALYVQAHGDFGPGGGFQAGVIFAAGFFMYGLVYGRGELERLLPPHKVERVTAMGVLLYGGVGIASLVLGGNFLDYGVFTPEHPEHGQHWGILLVELGVGITVAAVMLIIYYRFAGREQPRRIFSARHLTPDEVEGSIRPGAPE